MMSKKSVHENCSPYLLPVRVYYEDTDSGGVVYHANYVKFMERARTEWLRTKGIEQDDLLNDYQLIFAVKHMSIDFVQSARFNDLLVVGVNVCQHSKVSLVFQQDIFRIDRTQTEDILNHGHTYKPMEHAMMQAVFRDKICSGQVKVVSLDAQTMRPKRIVKSVFEEIVSGY